MYKTLLILAALFFGACSKGNIDISDLPECKSQSDKISGCVEKIRGNNGNVSVEMPYLDGKKNGVVKIYYENGNLAVETTLKNDKIDGIFRKYYENGSLYYEVPFSNDEEYGTLRAYNENGDLMFSIYMENGEIKGGECKNGDKLEGLQRRKLLYQAEAICENWLP